MTKAELNIWKAERHVKEVMYIWQTWQQSILINQLDNEMLKEFGKPYEIS